MYIACENPCLLFIFFFFNDTATTEIYTLSLHDALPISSCWATGTRKRPTCAVSSATSTACACSSCTSGRSEEHTSELQSRFDLVCRLLLEKKKNTEPNALCPFTLKPLTKFDLLIPFPQH